VSLAPRERKLLLVLAVLAGLAGLRALWSLVASGVSGASESSLASAATLADSPAAAARPAFGRGSRRGVEELPKEIVGLDLGEPAGQPNALTVGRDPFRFGAPPPPPPPPPPTKEDLERMRRQEEERRLAAERAALEALIEKPPPVTLVYLGSFGTEKRRIAVFADAAGENLYNVRVGETVEGKFIVDRIGYESVDLKFVGFPDEPAKRLPIGG
jgi:hypothetical protein